MGDGGNQFLILFVPVVLTPLFSLGKWLILVLAWPKSRPWLRFILTTSLAETLLPAVSFFVEGWALQKFPAGTLPEGRTLTFGVFHIIFYVSAVPLNYLCLKWNKVGVAPGPPRWRMAMTLSIAPCALFATAWHFSP